MVRRFSLSLALLTLTFCSGLHAGDNTFILLTGKKHQTAGAIGFESNMIAFRDSEGTARLISKGLVDWPRTAQKSPELFKQVYPGRPLPEPPKTNSPYANTKKPKKQIVIDKKALSRLKPGQGMANKWEGDIPDTSKIEAKDKEKGLVQTLIDTLTGESSNQETPDPKTAKKGRVDISTISHGEAVEIKRHIEPGRVVLFDFYADWCGPCRKITPELEGLARKYPGQVVLKKIDIKNWNSAVAQQYGIRSIPHVVLYDQRGKKRVDGNALEAIREADQIARKNGW